MPVDTDIAEVHELPGGCEPGDPADMIDDAPGVSHVVIRDVMERLRMVRRPQPVDVYYNEPKF
jgi:hypothetical protein